MVCIFLSFHYKWHQYNNKNSSGLIFLGGAIIAFSWLIYNNASFGVIPLLFVLLAWLSLSQCYFPEHMKKKFIYAIFWLAIIQSLLGLVQTFCPDIAYHWFEYNWQKNQGRPFGIFQQVNLLGSFLASGIGCAGLLIFIENNSRYRKVLLAGISLITFVLTVNQSRAGEIGAGLILIFQSIIFWQTQPRRVVTLMLAVCAGISAVFCWWLIIHFTVNQSIILQSLQRTYSGSNSQRLFIYQTTLKMIMEKPWSGWGYGAFEAQFSRYVLAHSDIKNATGIIPHPHNELLFLWFQGGIVALVGLLTVVIGWFKIILKAKTYGPVTLCYALLIVPLIIHLNVEYPFYQSFIHFGLFIILLRLGIPESETEPQMNNLASTIKWYPIFHFLPGLVLVSFSIVAIYTNMQLTYLERTNLKYFPDTTPWNFYSQPQRSELDRNVALLMKYNINHDNDSLQEFYKWGSEWSTRNIDGDILNYLASIDHFYGRKEEEKDILALHAAVYSSRK